MKALTWHGHRDVRVDTVDDPTIEEPTDIIIEVSSSGLCGSDLHLYEVLTMYLEPGDVLGHEPMGTVVETGAAVTSLTRGDRVVVPFNISCGSCFMCDRDLYSQCETTQVTEFDKGASLFGYTKLYGQIPGGQAEYLRVPFGDTGPIKVPQGPADDRFVYLSDVLPTAWQAVEYAAVPAGGTVAVFGLGPIGQMATRIAAHRGVGLVIGIDRVPERLDMAERHGIVTIDERAGDVVGRLRDLTDGRGPDSVIDAVGMEAHGSPLVAGVQRGVSMLPGKLGAAMTDRVGIDRLNVLHDAIDAVRRGGTVSVSGVYGGMVDPMPMMTMFDKGIALRMGQANVLAWTDAILPLVIDDADPLGTQDLATHRLPLTDAPEAYAMFQQKADGAVKVLFDPAGSMKPVARAVDVALEATVVGAHTTIGFDLRRRLEAWGDPVPGDLTGRRFVITGATNGIGYRAALALTRAGAEVHSPSRSRASIERATAEFAAAGVGDRVHLTEADLARPHDVRRYVAELHDAASSLDGVAHCAGAFFDELGHTPEGIERNAAVYVLGPQLLTLGLVDLIEAAPEPRVVWVSSSGAYARRLDLDAFDPSAETYRPLAAYAHAKRAQIALAHAWHRRTGFASDAMTPGWTDTDLVRSGLPRFRRAFRPILRSPEQGADTLVWLLARRRPVDTTTDRLWRDRRPRLEHRAPWTLGGDTPDELWAWCDARLRAVEAPTGASR